LIFIRKDYIIVTMIHQVSFIIVNPRLSETERIAHQDNKKSAVEALTKIDPKKPLGTELFNAISRFSVGVPIEPVVIRKNSDTGELEVLLAWRDETAPAYQNSWHCPGTFLRPGESQEEAINRIGQGEFGCPVQVVERVGWDDNPDEERGHCVHLIFLAEPIGEPQGKWFPVDNLPPETVEHHRQVIIPMAVEAFRKHLDKSFEC